MSTFETYNETQKTAYESIKNAWRKGLIKNPGNKHYLYINRFFTTTTKNYYINTAHEDELTPCDFATITKIDHMKYILVGESYPALYVFTLDNSDINNTKMTILNTTQYLLEVDSI